MKGVCVCVCAFTCIITFCIEKSVVTQAVFTPGRAAAAASPAPVPPPAPSAAADADADAGDGATATATAEPVAEKKASGEGPVDPPLRGVAPLVPI